MATERESDLLSSVLQKSGKASAPVFHGKTDKRKQLQSYEFFRNFPEAVPDRTISGIARNRNRIPAAHHLAPNECKYTKNRP